jgi:ABC-type transporter Mla subunit MlaD
LAVGLFVLTALGLIVGTLIVTSGLGDVRYDIYFRTESAQDLTRDTRVLLQGLEIGRVQQLNPVRGGGAGTLSFVGRLSINENFPDGTPVVLPAGSKALIAQTSSNPISATVVQIMTPRTPRGSLVALQPGDTIDSERRSGTMDQLGTVVEQLSVEVQVALKETRRLLSGTNRAVARTDSMLATTAPLIQQVLTDLAGTLERTDRMLATLEPRLPALSDSINATLSDTRQLLTRLDGVAQNANTLATENRTSIRETLEHLRRSSILMDHFIQQVSRRPMRMLTGVRPQADSNGARP